jgi:hypothetical protein
MSLQMYLRNTHNCQELARTATTDAERARWNDMAKVWLQRAQEFEQTAFVPVNQKE